MANSDCQLETLLSSKTCDIQVCKCCGVFHLTMGPLSLRLNEAHFTDLVQDMGVALAQFNQSEKAKFNPTSNVRKLHS